MHNSPAPSRQLPSRLRHDLAESATSHNVPDDPTRLAVDARLAALTHEHQGFQRLIADLAVRVGRATDDALAAAIVESLRQVGDALQLDRIVVWHRRADAAVAVATHDWARTDPAPPLAPLPITAIPQVLAQVTAGHVCGFESVDELPEARDREAVRQHGVRSYLIVPIPAATDRDGDLRALGVGTVTRPQAWTPPLVERLRLVAAVLSQALARTASHASLQQALTEIRDLRSRLGRETGGLHSELRSGRAPSIVVSESPAIRQVLAQIDQVAPTPATVLLLGETGVGKEVMAQAIHDRSPRHQRPMVRVSCAAIPTALIESELFGRERGAYTGALSRQIGRFEAANQSTLFLDEIGDLPMEVQVKLLRVLQERTVERLGSTQPIKVDVRIIAATNRNLEDAVAAKTFREDLFYRLNVFPIVVPPLRTRVDDIAGLVWSFIDEFSRLFGKTINSIDHASMRELQHYPWPGNVRELRNVIERAAIIATGPHLTVSAPSAPARPLAPSALTLSALEVDHIRAILDGTNWRVRGPGGAAERLGLKPTTLESRMARLGIVRKKA
jgi:transcriptional regulator with GAF, ATPase, and Fis domain